MPGRGPASDPTDFMSGWKFSVAWVEAGQPKPVANVTVITTSSRKVVFSEYDRAPWTYTLTVPSKGIPLTDTLSISILSKNGANVTTMSAEL
ncbi:MAG: hypothetical protein WB680_16260 [Candidatus Acidiferrales bacterium]